MPVLPYSVIGSWYLIQDQNFNTILSENWTNKQRIDTSKRSMIQGDIGTHVMSIGGIVWETNLTSPVILIDNLSGGSFLSIFDYIVANFNNIRITYSSAQLPLMKSASITFKDKGVDCNLVLWSDNQFGFNAEDLSPVLQDDPYTTDFIARTAMFYDTLVTLSNNLPESYSIIDGSINIDVDIKENYFINTSNQQPYFSVQGYHVNGKVKVLAVPTDTLVVASPQHPGDLSAEGYSVADITIGTTVFNISDYQVIKSVQRSITPDNVTTIDIEFECFARYSTPVT